VKQKKAVSTSSKHITPVVYYPVFLNLKGKKVIVIGGGRVAERKILALLKTGADISVISPQITRRIQSEKQAPVQTIPQRRSQTGIPCYRCNGFSGYK
jgi:thioredoxin reductase